jgi:Zn-dependent protease with chaperone function
MKKLITLTILAIIGLQLSAQFTLNLTGISSKSGRKVELRDIVTDGAVDSTSVLKAGDPLKLRILEDGELNSYKYADLKKFRFDANNLKQFWQNEALNNGVYESLAKYGMQYDLRDEREGEALKFLNELGQQGLVFEDSYLESYLYTLTYKIYPGSIEDGRPGILNVKVMMDNAPNAFIFPNGTMILTIGLLSTLNSEEELTAVMAHEIAHFVLDHSLINQNKAIKRQHAAEFWAGFATVVAGAISGYASSQQVNINPVVFTMGTAFLSFTIASAFSERLNLKYSREQETAADQCAVELLKFIRVDPTALSSALTKIKKYCIMTGNYNVISGNGTHPDIAERIRLIGTPNQFSSTAYDKIISFVNSSNAAIEFNCRHFYACQSLVDRNINSGVPTEVDYILKAMTNLYLYDTLEKNVESLELIKKAKSLNVDPNFNVSKQEALVLIRINRLPDALVALKSYSEKLDQEILNTEKIRNQELWSSIKQYLEDEKVWTAKMIYKVKTM